MKNKIRKIRKGIFIVENKIQKILLLIDENMSAIYRGGINNKTNVLSPANSLIRNYDRAYKLFEGIPKERFENDEASVEEIKRMTKSIQAYNLKTEIEKLFKFIKEEDTTKKIRQTRSIKKHLDMIKSMTGLMLNEKIIAV